jgi:hypothetical protein
LIPPTSLVLLKIVASFTTTEDGLTGSLIRLALMNTNCSAFGRAAKKIPGGGNGAQPTKPPPTRHDTHAGAQSMPGTQTQPKDGS